jgi:hypothetical protein
MPHLCSFQMLYFFIFVFMFAFISVRIPLFFFLFLKSRMYDIFYKNHININITSRISMIILVCSMYFYILTLAIECFKSAREKK